MESLLSLLRVHWDHEPTPNPSQEGNFRGAGECLLPSWEGSGVGRFMESSRSGFSTKSGVLNTDGHRMSGLLAARFSFVWPALWPEPRRADPFAKRAGKAG